MPVDFTAPPIEDGQLLRLYLENRAQSAFTELVQRHLKLVYFAALRRVHGDSHLAEEVTQAVFSDLARKAATLKNRPTLTGWLYTSTRYAAAQALRSERRRKNHEQEARTMEELHPSGANDWERLRPVIDEAMDELSEHDREAVLMRFFEDRPLAQIGARLSLSPDAARMRVDRALQKLHRALARRGIISTSTALAAAFAAQSTMAVPADLVGKITAGALAQLGTTGAVMLPAWKLATGIAVLSAGVGVVAFQLRRTPVDPSEVQPALVQSTETPTTKSSPPSETRSASVTKPAAVASAPAKRRRSSSEFGWPVVSLFAGDESNHPQHTVAEFHEKMAQDAEFRATVVEQAKDRLGFFYQRLFDSLHLPASQLDQFEDLLVEKELLSTETREARAAMGFVPGQNHSVVREEIDQAQRELDNEIKKAIGDSAYIQYVQYREDLIQWTVVGAVADRLRDSATPLTDDQAQKLAVLLRSSLLRIRAPYTFDISFGSGLFSAHLGSGLTRRSLNEASLFLSPPQVDVLRKLQRPQSPRLK